MTREARRQKPAAPQVEIHPPGGHQRNPGRPMRREPRQSHGVGVVGVEQRPARRGSPG